MPVLDDADGRAGPNPGKAKRKGGSDTLIFGRFLDKEEADSEPLACRPKQTTQIL
jgi:hypothetical protein